ncbi:uracil-DNA glycosylase [Psychroserpens ponticola]|uniref:Uracil-DNA glycosylase n=1 Tax=Psychroserpens ponticola TaxID=2932268 RepID=A0ABY7S1I6_9FLAO|nr:uracil-DNA glycosylase [Psychroserpens ponticola]WCO03249.1 uracil-DNA glycosylase [Psychroserpens ponticola]
MKVNIHESWKNILIDEFDKPYFKDLLAFVETEYLLHNCYPIKNQIFSALNNCHFNDVKIVIIGQDPYHGEGQANGLCFSVNDTVSHPPSLVNVFKEIERDLGLQYPESGNLERWAKQGVLLLNATLTVRAQQAGSHQKKGWENFTNAIIKIISKEKKEVVFLLWGGFAKQKAKFIDGFRHHILTSGHPSPLSANRGYWFNNKHFSKANLYLTEKGYEPINWE